MKPAAGVLSLSIMVLSTRFKPIYGKEDQAGRLSSRVLDPDHYSILRANASEDNLNLYKYNNGRRSAIAGLSERTAVVEATDDTFARRRVGLWTKADPITCFDGVEAKVV